MAETDVFNSIIHTAGDGLDLGSNIDTLFIASGAAVAGEGPGHDGVNFTGSGLFATVAGSVYGSRFGIYAGTGDATIMVEKTGSVTSMMNGGGRAIAMESGALTNDGVITGQSAVYIGGAALVQNSGTIQADAGQSLPGTAIVIDNTTPGASSIGNTGSIVGAFGIWEQGNSAATVTNSGSILGVYNAVTFASTAVDTLINSGTIAAAANVSDSAVRESGSGVLDVTNSGHIQSVAIAIDDYGTANMSIANTAGAVISAAIGIQYNATAGGAADTLENDGTIRGKAIAVFENGTAALNVVNSGIISSTGTTLQYNGAATFTDTLDNSGTIRTTLPGGNAIVENGGAALNLTNAGRIVGNVVFGTGGGTYDGTQGHVTGAVEGGATGNDTFKGGNGDEHFIGGGGNDVLKGGAGDDVLQGNAGHDNLYGGQDSDTFVYLGSSDSHGASSHDTVFGFDATQDKFDLDVSVNKVEAAITTGSLSNATFGADMADLLTTAHLHAHHAVLVTADAGDLAGQTFLIVDHNQTAGYQSADYVIALSGATNLASLGVDNFM